MKQPSILPIVLTPILLVGVGARVPAQVPAQKSMPTLIIHASNNSGYLSSFEICRTRDRGLELEIQKKGLDLAFTEWMQRDHPYVFAAECAKQRGNRATELKSTNHMLEFEKLANKRADLHYKASKYGYDVAFTEWLRTERPETYREQFGVK